MINKKNIFDIVIIGGGHAGIEASLISAKSGCKTLLITQNIKKIGELSCNPSIGGIGKSQLVKEIDAFNGIMGKNTDESAIQYKILNLTKGEAVRSTRVQVDKILYKKNIFNNIKNQKNLLIVQNEVKKIKIIKKEIIEIKIKKNIKINTKIKTKILILTTGTFLNGKIYIGKKNCNGGRIKDKFSLNLSKSLKKNGFNLKRLKTGTPPRIIKNFINYKKLKYQNIDNNYQLISYIKKKKNINQIKCYITKTNIKIHKIIKKNLKYSPMYNGLIKNLGPRYCPSIEDKIIRFNNKTNHKIFLELESFKKKIIYPNGISISLPYKIQKKIIKNIKGLENSKIIQPGYAIEYDYINPINLKKTLETKNIKRLFFAGQINGTTGYEEAASQGLIAGLNASLIIKKKKKWIPNKNISYIGVLINDLCNLGIKEPYRIFTSRAKNRLIMREDNADLRLTKIGRKLGIVDNNRWMKFLIKKNKIINKYKKTRNIWIKLNKLIKKKFYFLKKKKKINYEKFLSYYNITYKIINKIIIKNKIKKNKKINKIIETYIKYKGYIRKINIYNFN